MYTNIFISSGDESSRIFIGFSEPNVPPAGNIEFALIMAPRATY